MQDTVAYSVLKPYSILLEAKRHYAWPETAQLGLKHTGTDTLYTAILPDGIFLLRLYSAHRKAETIAAEVDLLVQLGQAGLSVSQPLPTVDGSFTWTIKAPEGRRTLVLYEYIIGVAPGWRLTTEQAQSFGEATAKFHTITNQVDASWHRFDHDQSYFLGRELSHLLERAPASSRAILDDTIGLLEKAFQGFSNDNETSAGICHGDLHKGNFIVDHNNQTTLIDFGCCGYGWRAYDLATAKWSIQAIDNEQAHRDALYNAFLASYHRIHTLSTADLGAIPYFFAARHLWYMKVLVRRALLGMDIWYPLTDKWFDQESTWLQTWLSANLASRD